MVILGGSTALLQRSVHCAKSVAGGGYTLPLPGRRVSFLSRLNLLLVNELPSLAGQGRFSTDLADSRNVGGRPCSLPPSQQPSHQHADLSPRRVFYIQSIESWYPAVQLQRVSSRLTTACQSHRKSLSRCRLRSQSRRPRSPRAINSRLRQNHQYYVA